MSEVIIDTLLDVLKLIPFLFVTYLVMEYIEHKTSEKSEAVIGRAGRFGPVIGGLLGMGVFDTSPETARRLIDLGRKDAREALKAVGMAK